MPWILLIVGAIVLFSVGAMVYAYRWRGQERWAGPSEYFKKGWPIFTPFNCLLYIFTKARASKPIMNPSDFPELQEIQKHWPTIREEAMALYEKNYFEKTKDPNSSAFFDIGFRTFYKYGWGKFYLNWYGHTHNSAKKLCPKTVEILKDIPTVNGAMFSLLPVGSQLTRHLDPVACSLRYHLGLRTPNNTDCFINVDGTAYSWKDGEPFIFDETYLHFAKNNSTEARLILMCDIERPMHFIGKTVNFFYKGLMRLTLVPNIEGDKRGLTNSIFATLSPILKKSKNLKQTNRPAYLLLKYSVNITLLVIVLSLLTGLVSLGVSLAEMLSSDI